MTIFKTCYDKGCVIKIWIWGLCSLLKTLSRELWLKKAKVGEGSPLVTSNLWKKYCYNLHSQQVLFLQDFYSCKNTLIKRWCFFYFFVWPPFLSSKIWLSLMEKLFNSPSCFVSIHPNNCSMWSWNKNLIFFCTWMFWPNYPVGFFTLHNLPHQQATKFAS